MVTGMGCQPDHGNRHAPLPPATDPAVLHAALWALGVGGLILVPSLLYLFAIFQSNRFAPADNGHRQ